MAPFQPLKKEAGEEAEENESELSSPSIWRRRASSCIYITSQPSAALKSGDSVAAGGAAAGYVAVGAGGRETVLVLHSVGRGRRR